MIDKDGGAGEETPLLLRRSDNEPLKDIREDSFKERAVAVTAAVSCE